MQKQDYNEKLQPPDSYAKIPTPDEVIFIDEGRRN